MHVCAGVPQVIHPHCAISEACVHVVVVVMAPTAAPHWHASVVGLDHGVCQQATIKETQKSNTSCQPFKVPFKCLRHCLVLYKQHVLSLSVIKTMHFQDCKLLVGKTCRIARAKIIGHCRFIFTLHHQASNIHPWLRVIVRSAGLTWLA